MKDTAVNVIHAALSEELFDADGDPLELELLPGLTEAEIDALQADVGQALPQEMRAVLRLCSGIEGGPLDGIDFTGRGMAFAHEEVFPRGLPIAADGAGNFWVLDITPDTTEMAPVFFACHDAPVVLYQSGDVRSFLAEVFRLARPPHRSLVSDVGADRIFDVWHTNPGVLEHPVAAASTDPEVRAFASGLPSHFQVIDLRRATPGMGFSWGRYGPETQVRRHGWERIFAYGKPQERGWWGKLFGRRNG
jgi:hypothetical protein